jgi:hypothetical protein
MLATTVPISSAIYQRAREIIALIREKGRSTDFFLIISSHPLPFNILSLDCALRNFGNAGCFYLRGFRQ